MNKYKIEEILSNIQFQVYSDMNFIEPLGLDKETWKELLEYIDKQKQVIDKIKEIFKDYGVKEDIVTYSMYQITGEEVYKILELLEKIE